MGMAVVAVVALVVAVVVLWAISAYNRLVTLATSVDNDWAQIAFGGLQDANGAPVIPPQVVVEAPTPPLR